MAQEKSGLYQAVQGRVAVAKDRRAKAAEEIAHLEKRLACARGDYYAALDLESELKDILRLVETSEKGAEW